MDKKAIEKYMAEIGKFTIADIQFKFSSSYTETRELFLKLKSKRLLSFDGGVFFSWHKQSEDNKNDDKTLLISSLSKTPGTTRDNITNVIKKTDKMPLQYIDIIRFCIRKGVISVSLLQREFQYGYAKAVRTLEWLIKAGIVENETSKEKKVLLTKSDYDEIFGKLSESNYDQIKTSSESLAGTDIMKLIEEEIDRINKEKSSDGA